MTSGAIVDPFHLDPYPVLLGGKIKTRSAFTGEPQNLIDGGGGVSTKTTRRVIHGGGQFEHKKKKKLKKNNTYPAMSMTMVVEVLAVVSRIKLL